MAGSLNHIVDDNGTFTMEFIENMGDAHEALEECFKIIKALSGGKKQKLNRTLKHLNCALLENSMEKTPAALAAEPANIATQEPTIAMPIEARAALKPGIPIGTLVELKTGVRRFVVYIAIGLDGVPQYWLSDDLAGCKLYLRLSQDGQVGGGYCREELKIVDT